MIKRTFCWGILLLASRALPAATMAEVRTVGMSVSSEAASVTLELSSPATYKLFRLTDPARVVLDLDRVRLRPGTHLPGASGLIQSVRAGARPGGGLRVVLEVASPVPATAQWAGPGQLVVRLGGDSAVRALAAPQPVHAAHAPADSDRDVVIAVDAGHGGQDPGAIGHTGTQEKTVVLAIARALARRINAEPGMHAILTRDRDEFLTLRERSQRARAAKADLFVSVHADSIRDREVSGSSVYILSERGATDEAARWLAERENASDLMGGVSLSDKDSTLASVLLDLSQSANISASMNAAQLVLSELDRVGEVRKSRVQEARFVVLKSPDIPSMLIETAYISNPTDERRLRAESHQVQLAEAIFTGLHVYFEKNPPAGTRFARSRTPPTPPVLAGTSEPAPATLYR